MKRITALLTALALILGLCACKSTAARWQKQYDLGVRYMEKGNYEEAILAFNAAIEIDPMQADAYLNLANAYIGMNDFDAAKEILEKGYELTGAQALKDKLDEIESGNISDYWGNPRKHSGYDGAGNLQWYQIYEYNGKQMVSVTTYNSAGVKTGYWDDYRYDEQGRQIRSMTYQIEDGLVMGYCEHIYDEKGNMTRQNMYDLDSTPTGYWIGVYDEEGKQTSQQYYNEADELEYYWETVYEGNRIVSQREYDADGTPLSHTEYRYNEDEKMVGWVHYDADGKVILEQRMGD